MKIIIRTNVVKKWSQVLFWAGLIYFLSGIPHLNSGLKCDFILRKTAHALEYFILTFLLYRAFKDTIRAGVFQIFICPAALSFLYTLSDEFHQSFVSGRSGCGRDVLIDAIGILGFYIALRVFANIEITKPESLLPKASCIYLTHAAQKTISQGWFGYKIKVPARTWLNSAL